MVNKKHFEYSGDQLLGKKLVAIVKNFFGPLHLHGFENRKADSPFNPTILY